MQMHLYVEVSVVVTKTRNILTFICWMSQIEFAIFCFDKKNKCIMNKYDMYRTYVPLRT